MSELTTKLKDRMFRLSHLYKIQNKYGKKVTFKPNFAQLSLINKYKEIVEYNKQNTFYPKKNWIVILKARQLGISTFKLVEGLDTALFYPNKNVIVIAHKKDKLQDLFQKVKFAYDNMPPAIDTPDGRWIKPKTRFDNRNELKFMHKEGESSIKIALDSRSGTATNLHISELAFIKNASDMLAATEPSIENGIVTIETTANGFNFFYDFWNKNTGNPNSDYTTFFIPWYEDKNYKKPIANARMLPECPKELSHVEKLYKNGTINIEQWNWYLHKYTSSTEKDTILQEYPTVPEDAFIGTGRPVFDLQKVKEMDVVDVTDKMDKDKFIQDDRFKDLYYFDGGKGGDNLLIGVDVSEGVKGGDYSTIVVCKRNYEVVAVYRGHIAPDALPLVIDKLYDKGYKAHKAIGIEKNNHGLTTLTACKEYPWYSDVYIERVEDKRTRTITNKPGFHTNVKTKELIINFLRSLVNDDLINVKDKRIKTEMFTYYYDDNGASNAIAPNHDDLVMALAICLHMRHQMPVGERLSETLLVARKKKRRKTGNITING